MGSQTLARGALSISRAHLPPARASPCARDHYLSAAAARVLRLEAPAAASATYLWNRVLGLLCSGRGGSTHLARRVFDAMPERDAVSYNTLIACLSRAGRGHAERARSYERMLREDGVRPTGTTLSALLALSGGGGGDAASRGFFRQVHAHAVRLGLCSNAFVGSALVQAYERCGDADAVGGVFEEIEEPDVVCWNVMIDACTRRGSVRRAVEVLSRMCRGGGVADGFTLASILKACFRSEDLGLGMQLHACAWKVGFDSETVTCNALITMYLKCGGRVSSAVDVFDWMLEPNIISWTAMIAGLVQNGFAMEAAGFYKQMVRVGDKENDFCFTSVLSAFGALASLEHGKMVHCRAVKTGFCFDMILGNALLDMYFKCGSSADAQFVFDTMWTYDVVSWTAMIVGYGRHGEARKAVDCFGAMVDGGFRPDGITILAVLSACSQGGLVDEGLSIFHSMADEHGIEPQREHYACLVYLLGHAGRLKEAEKLIRKMGLQLDSFAWESLLGACGIHGEVELGKRSAGKVMELEPWKDEPFVLLSNMYAEQCQWREKEMLRERLNYSNVRKDAALSWFPVSEAN
ncbi:pentatricopeptide repeat-containing protein At2g22070-like [Phragmites australis]|uniref:pentatricopeptide repeat-containing protein At2g22070-like n=1 Tax=Phragmites australis TaxID=29695 RepID=UPI002D795508|nr:pentatricopeptide repeat-containing protein At2g22070-like [Phragmites australis]